MTVAEVIGELTRLQEAYGVPDDAPVKYATRHLVDGSVKVQFHDIVVGVADFGREVTIGSAFEEQLLVEAGR